MADYFKYTFTIDPVEPGRDILIAELEGWPFESMVETDEGIEAYILEDEAKDLTSFDWSFLDPENFKVAFDRELVKTENWNETWESNFQPIQVREDVFIRAPFHEARPEIPMEVVIMPKMSFGTGHHQTTSLMIEMLLDHPPKGKDLLDMGCGTAILAIVAGKLGAENIDAVDIDEWAYENALENVAMNDQSDINVIMGGSEVLGDRTYDVIYANINRNILLQDMEAYSRVLRPNGELYLSGFYSEDVPVLVEYAANFGMELTHRSQKDNWTALRLFRA